MNCFLTRFLAAGFLLLLPSLLFARQIVIGSGTGAVFKNDMGGLKPGDTLAIRAGEYDAGGSFSHLSRITIVNYRGIVRFTHALTFSHLSDVVFSGTGQPGLEYGFSFRKMHGDAVVFEGPCKRFTVAQCEFRDVEGSAYDASHTFVKYSGDSAGLALNRVRFTGQRLVHSGPFFTGSFAACPLFENVLDSVSFTGVVVDSTMSEGPQLLAHSIYHFLVSDWKVTGPAPNAHRDFGIIQTMGNGTVRNFYRHGGWGYIWRNWNAGLNERGESWIYNCIDLASNHYGTVDTRIEAVDTSVGNSIPFCRGGNMHVFNNTSGNKRADSYVTVLVVVGDFFSAAGYKTEVRNNLCFNNLTDNANKMFKQNTMDPLPDTSNNIYCDDPIAAGLLLDTVECQLNPKGWAINGGVPTPRVITDFAGIRRPVGEGQDIGAREYPDAAVNPPRPAAIVPVAPFRWKRTLAGVGFALFVAGGLYLTAKKAFRKPKGRSTLSPRELNSRRS